MSKTINTFLRIIKSLNIILTKQQKKDSIIVMISMLLCSLLELLGVSVIFPFLQIVVDADNMVNNSYIRLISILFPSSIDERKGVLIIMTIGIIILYITKNSIAIICAYIQADYSTRFLRETAVMMLKAYMHRPYEFFSNTNSSIIIRGVGADTAAVYNVINCIFQILTEIMTGGFIAVYLLYTDWKIAISSLFIALCAFLSIFFLFRKKMKRAGNKLRMATAEITKNLYHSINGYKEICALDRKSYFVNEYEKAAIQQEKTGKIFNFLSACPDRIIEGVCISGILGVLCYRVVGETNIGEFIPVLGVFAMGAFKILPSVAKITTRVNQIVYYIPGVDSCCENMQTMRFDESDDLPCKNRGDSEQLQSVFNKFLTIDNIWWKYQNSKEYVLSNLSMKIEKGEAVGIIGESGAGKSTLADIIMGLLQPQKGEILIDGFNYYDLLSCMTKAKLIGYVPQSVFLIDDTIRANVAFGIAKENVDEEKVWKALEDAQLKKVVYDLPEQLDTFVGERGVRLSGGQCQRIAIARALYENPEIVLLDEATSALDYDTENAVMESIEQLYGKKTLIIIAHRLSTISKCDKVYRIIDGKAILQPKSELEI